MRRGWGFGVRESDAFRARSPRPDRRARRLLPRLVYSRGRALHQRRPALATTSCAVSCLDADHQSVADRDDGGDEAGIVRGKLYEPTPAARICGLIARGDFGAVEGSGVAPE